MEKYQKILVALELNSKIDANLLRQAEMLAKLFNAEITVVHAIEFVSGYGAYGVSLGTELEEVLMKEAKKEMVEIGKKFNIPEHRQVVKFGSAKFVVLEEAERNKADLIVLGSHGRQGIRMLLGSTANAVLHGAKCDVLAVRLRG
jgi:universal stress protein A